ncbi:MAG: efflux RND transporter periplasmic adaptor subunit [Hyphomicrobium sp.]|jgi:membrane fusion protein (multidrug efflux system)|nr:efflux RND transporter periplasmic adaptor subunit [Hyphomicrobium sp.]
MRALLLGGLVCSAAVGWWLLTVAGVDEALGLRSPAEAQDRPAATSGSLPARAVAVEVATARAVRTSTDIRAIGSLQSDETVQLAPEIAGRVSEIDFVEGTPVKSGDILVRLDDALAKAEVKDAEARLSFAEANNERARQLSRTGNVTERSVDEAVTNLETARAAVELAATRLDKHLLRAPFDGIAGVRKVSVGAFVAVGTPVVNIEKIDKLKVDFKVPEIHLNAVSPGQIIDVTVDAIPGKVFEGKIYAINPQVDVNGRALQARAVIDNTDLLLRPGLFARILIKGAEQRDAVVVPESAILPRAGDNFVFRVEQGVARQARVKLGERRAGLVEIAEGLDPGDIVVTAGQHKLRDGTAVESVATHPQGDVSDSDQDKSKRSGG